MVRHHGTEDNTLGQTIVKPTALGPVANTDTKLLIYGLFQKGRVLAQDGIPEIVEPLFHLAAETLLDLLGNLLLLLLLLRKSLGDRGRLVVNYYVITNLSSFLWKGASAIKCWWLPRNPLVC